MKKGMGEKEAKRRRQKTNAGTMSEGTGERKEGESKRRVEEKWIRKMNEKAKKREQEITHS